MKKQFAILVLAVFLVSFASAGIFNYKKSIDTSNGGYYEFDNGHKIGYGDSKITKLWKTYPPIEIKNLFGKTKLQLALTNHTETCGQNCFSTMEIYLPNDGTLIDDIKFYTLQDDNFWIEQNIRNYQFKYLGLIDDYKTQCTEELITSENGTYLQQNCEEVLIGNHEGLINYNLGEELPAGEYTLKLTGEKKPSRTVDWIIETKGEVLDSLAVWGNISTGDDAEVILNSPANGSIVYFNPVTFNSTGTITGGAYLINMSLWTNESGSWVKYNSTILDQGVQGNPFGDTYGGHNNDVGTFGVTFTTQNEYIRVLNYNPSYPIYLYSDLALRNSANTIIADGLTAIKAYELQPLTEYKLTFYKSGEGGHATYTANTTFVSSVTGIGIYSPMMGVTFKIINHDTTSTQTFDRTITDDIIWNVQACDSDGDCGFAPSNYSLSIDTTIPLLQVDSPNETFNYLKTNQSLNLNVTATDSNLDTCWYNYNGTNQTFSCTTGVQANETFLQGDNFNLTVYANDSVGNLNSETTTWDYILFENSRTLNTTSYETKQETFQINVPDGTNLTAVTLDYNGTEYATTKSGTVYSKTFDIPSANLGNNSVRWKFTYAGDTIYSDYSYQNILEAVWTICNASYTDDFLNISFKDEATLGYINASIPTSTFVYYLGSGAVNKTYTYVNTSVNYNYEFCATPDLTFNVDSYIQYKQGTDYPQKIYDPESIEYTSTITNKLLYLLSSVDGIYVTFQVINSAEQTISGVEVSGTRVISSEEVNVAQGLTDASGSVTFWLNPDFSHTFSFSKDGYEDEVYTVTPTQSAYTVSMGGGIIPETDCTRGMSYQITPSNNFLDQNTEYDFSFIMDTSYWALTLFNASLYYGNGTLIDSDSSTIQEGGTLSFNDINTTNQTEMYLEYSYEVNDSVCFSSSVNWIIQSIDGRDYSIWNLFNQSKTYLDSNLYGIKGESGNNDFGIIVIIFLIIVLVTGVSIQKFGVQSEQAIMSIIFGLVAMLDFGFNLIPRIQIGGLSAIPHFITIMTFLLWLAFVIKER